METKKFFNTTNLNSTLLLGYYGGTNFGDELLLEVIQNALIKNKYKDIAIRYTNPSVFNTYHKDYKYQVVDARVFSLLKVIITKKNILVGGGGFWGLDFNLNTFLMGVILFIARFVLFKKVYLVGVGYYSSASFFGKVGAFIAGMAANKIIARDAETFNNFKKTLFFCNNKLSLNKDIVFYLHDFIDDNDYQKEFDLFLDKHQKLVNFKEPISLVGIRRFHNKKIEKNSIKSIKKTAGNIFFAFENINLFKKEYETIFKKLRITNNANVINFKYNPVILFLFFKKYKNTLKIFAPQFHVIMIAYLAGVEFAPISYDNKVTELLKQIGTHEKNIIKIYE